jgi:hypothetical protein
MSLNNYMHIALLLLPLCHMHGITTPAQLDAYPNHSADLRAARTIIIIWFSGHLHAAQPSVYVPPSMADAPLACVHALCSLHCHRQCMNPMTTTKHSSI